MFVRYSTQRPIIILSLRQHLSRASFSTTSTAAAAITHKHQPQQQQHQEAEALPPSSSSSSSTSTSTSFLGHSAVQSHSAINVPLSGVQRGLLTAVSAVTALIDPKRADMVAALGETTGLEALARLRIRMRAHPVGNDILNERPNLTTASLNLERLRTLPKETFGGSYVRWMDQYGYSPDNRPEVRYIEDPELAFIMQRYRQIHDFSHVLLDLPPTVLGEVVIKWYELAQTQLPMTFLSALFGPFSVGPREWRLLLQSGAFAWASKVGTNSELLLCVKFEEHLDMSLVEMRTMLNLPVKGTPENIRRLMVLQQQH